MKLLSLFDGSGGFPLAGAMCGITPVAASEVEPFPIRVTTKRFPNMKHLGDISKINGAEIEPVDVITFGSPCQDLSVAGKRKGLNHSELGDEVTTRSGLFMEAVRIIRAMKEATNGEYPTFAVWENVPGAYSSNKGEDFRIVLEELEKTACNGADIVPKPPKGKWLNAGEIVGDNYSIAWRTLDAQFWGVPQRRRRIYLVADFRGKRAGKILFEREGLRGDFTQSRTPWQRTAGNVENGTGAADRAECIAFDTYNMVPTNDVTVTLRANSEYNYAPVFVKNDGEPILTTELGIASRDGGHCYANIAGTLRANAGDNQLSVVYAVENHPADSRVNIDDSGKVQTLTSRMRTGGGNVPLVMEPKPVVYDGAGITSPVNASNPQPGDPCHTLNTDSRNYVCIPIAQADPVYCLQGNGIDRADTAGCNGKGWKEDTSYTLNTVDRPAVCYSLDRAAYNQGINAQYDIGIDDSGTAHTLVAKGPGAVCYGIGNGQANQSFSEELAGALNCMHDQQAVAFWDGGQVTSTLTANNAGGNQRMPDKENFNCIIENRPPHYIVRRLTPLECCRLQGFPDWWCSDLETENPTESDIEFWREVFETHRTVISGTSKPKTDKQIIKWLKDPYSDSAIYKMWGNGIALPNALFVMQGIAEELCKN